MAVWSESGDWPTTPNTDKSDESVVGRRFAKIVVRRPRVSDMSGLPRMTGKPTRWRLLSAGVGIATGSTTMRLLSTLGTLLRRFRAIPATAREPVLTGLRRPPRRLSSEARGSQDAPFPKTDMTVCCLDVAGVARGGAVRPSPKVKPGRQIRPVPICQPHAGVAQRSARVWASMGGLIPSGGTQAQKGRTSAAGLPSKRQNRPAGFLRSSPFSTIMETWPTITM
jgi:hypothetical protein